MNKHDQEIPRWARAGAIAGGHRKFSALAVLCGAAVLSVVVYATAPNPVPATQTEKAWPVSSIVVQPQRLSPMFRLYGRVESSRIATLQTDTPARIESVEAREGQWVKRGQVLLRLDQRELQLRLRERSADLAQAQARLAAATADFVLVRASSQHYDAVQKLSRDILDRQRHLHKTRMISQSMLDQVALRENERSIEYQVFQRQLADFPHRIMEQRALLDRAQAALEQAQLNLNKATIVAPFDGPVIAVVAAAGSHALPGQPLLRMAQSAGFEVRAPLPNQYLNRLRHYLANHTEVHGFIPAQQGESSRTELSLKRLSSSVKSGQAGLDGFFSVDLQQPKKPLQQLPEIGRLVDLTVILPREDGVVALPVQSLYENNRIYEVVDSRLRAIDVERVGEFHSALGYQVLVRWQNSQPGQRIISTQLPRAISGLLVDQGSIIES
ncbi:MAG: multidrug efflux pump subunit AcrA (membrane-fusion protein) [Paraglaciecola psychrophila]|jgi:multidrug efflux pump subunit AcrA (membrane-fusion protein)